MSMTRQLWIAILLSTLLAFGGGLFAALLGARSYFVQELTLKNIDNANALAITLSQGPLDDARVALAVAALFDGGHYESIRIVDPKGTVLVERKAQLLRAGAPRWFMKLVPLEAEPGMAQISQGWKQFGTVTLLSASYFAYTALWESALRMAAALLFAGILAGWVGTLILRRLTPPLRAVVEQAEAITQRRFTTIALPRVPELAQLAKAMNSMVERLRTMFEAEAARLEAVRHEASLDAPTGLPNRGHFLGRLSAALSGEAAGGVLALARVVGLAELNQRLGRAATDDLLRSLATRIAGVAGNHADAFAGRLNGADFALFAPGKGEPRRLAEDLLGRLRAEAPRWEIDPLDFVRLGVVTLPPGTPPGSALAQADAALASAETSAEGVAIAASGAGTPLSAQEWERTLQQALDRRWARVEPYPLLDARGALVHWECPLRLRFSEDGEWQPAGRFMPVTERLGRTQGMDRLAVELGLQALEGKLAGAEVAINLSPQSVADAAFRAALNEILGRQPALASRLWLEVPERGALLHLEAIGALCRELAPLGCRVGIEHFGREFSQVGRLHGLGLAYLKVDASLVRGIEANAGNQTFLRGLCTIARAIGLKVYAEGVTGAGESNALAALGFDGVTGPGVRRPQDGARQE